MTNIGEGVSFEGDVSKIDFKGDINSKNTDLEDISP